MIIFNVLIYQMYTSTCDKVCPRNKISVITDISILGFYGYIENIGGYFDKNIGKAKINKNTLKFMKILC